MDFSKVKALYKGDTKLAALYRGDTKLWPVEDEGYYLAFSSPEAFTLELGKYGKQKNWDGVLEYSIDTVNWAEWDGTIALNSGSENKLYLRGVGNTTITGFGNRSGSHDYRWLFDGTEVFCDGNIETLLDYVTVQNGGHPDMGKRCFMNLFATCTALVTAPDLMAATLTAECYQYMFSGCSSLRTPPKMAAKTLAQNCCENMFQNCVSLKNAPELSASTLAERCCFQMFVGCTGLISAPALPATTLAENCYGYMFSDCTSINSLPELPATRLAQQCYFHMFDGCTSVRVSPSQTGVYQYAYRMPKEGTGVDALLSFDNMFSGTGGPFTGTPEINTTYYTDHEPVG